MKNIFVGNLDFAATESSIRSLFEPYGSVQRVNLVTDRDTGRSRGFAFVEMTDSAEAVVVMAIGIKRHTTVQRRRRIFTDFPLAGSVVVRACSLYDGRQGRRRSSVHRRSRRPGRSPALLPPLPVPHRRPWVHRTVRPKRAASQGGCDPVASSSRSAARQTRRRDGCAAPSISHHPPAAPLPRGDVRSDRMNS